MTGMNFSRLLTDQKTLKVAALLEVTKEKLS